jgi:thiol-disulfide isomerase/thioredoxin
MQKLLFLLLISTSLFADDFTILEEKKGEIKLLTLMQAHVKKAQELKQKLFIQITATWCGPCKRLQAAMPDDLMQDAFAGTYIVKLDADEWEDDFSQINIKINAVPVFFKVDADGKATDYTVNGGAWAEDIAINMAPPLKAYFNK